MNRLARWLAAFLAAAAPVLVTVPVVLSWRDRLPDELAVHWRLNEQPDGFTGRDGFLDGWAVASLVTLGVGLVATVFLGRRRRSALMIMGAVTGFLGALGLMLTVPSLDLTDPADARLGWVAALPLALIAATAGASWWIYGREPVQVISASAPPAPDLPRLAVGEAADFDEVRTLWWLAAGLAALFGAFGVVAWVTVSPWLGTELVLLGLLTMWLARLRVRADAAGGLTMTAGPFRVAIPIEEITGASVRESVDPLGELGGWGLRYRAGTVGLVTRKGPGVESGRTVDRKVVVTSDQPERLAAVLNSLADARFARSGR